MLYIALPESAQRHQLPFYLAMEEYVAHHVAHLDCFFTWQVEPTVIFGRNQLIENEVNSDFCERHHIQMYRRKSGGGCVYADMRNIMMSYVTSDHQVGFTFNRYVNMVVLVLQRMGIDARATGRNDVMIGERKVSGSAFYKTGGRSIVHGTLLYDADLTNMVGAITPSDDKLLSKGVASVRQRVTQLKEHTTMTLDEVVDFIRRQLCDEVLTLTPEQVAAIDEAADAYRSDDFIYGKNPHYTIVKQRRIESVGEIEARIELKNGIIKHIDLTGDYFPTGDLDRDLLDRLRGLPLSVSALRCHLPERVDDIILNLTTDDLVMLLTGEEAT